MREVMNCGILEGSYGSMAFTCSLPLLSAQRYLLAGQMLQWSVQHGGPGMPVLSAEQYQLLLDDEFSPSAAVVVPDANTTSALREVKTFRWA